MTFNQLVIIIIIIYLLVCLLFTYSFIYEYSYRFNRNVQMPGGIYEGGRQRRQEEMRVR